MIADWQMLARHYAGNTTVVGADLFNEPHAEGTYPNGTGSCWGCGDTARDWRLAAERIGNAVHAANPNWLVLVEGVSCPGRQQRERVGLDPRRPERVQLVGRQPVAASAKYPVRLNVANQLVYSAHDYGISVYDHQAGSTPPSTPTSRPTCRPSGTTTGATSTSRTSPRCWSASSAARWRDPRDTQWMTDAVSTTWAPGQRHVVHVLVVEPGLRRHRRHRAGRLGHGEHEQAVHPQPALVPPVKPGTTPTGTPTPTPTAARRRPPRPPPPRRPRPALHRDRDDLERVAHAATRPRSPPRTPAPGRSTRGWSRSRSRPASRSPAAGTARSPSAGTTVTVTAPTLQRRARGGRHGERRVHAPTARPPRRPAPSGSTEPPAPESATAGPGRQVRVPTL